LDRLSEARIIFRLSRFMKKVCSIEEYRSSDLLDKFLIDKKGFQELAAEVL
jgi:hypothetical protein